MNAGVDLLGPVASRRGPAHPHRPGGIGRLLLLAVIIGIALLLSVPPVSSSGAGSRPDSPSSLAPPSLPRTLAVPAASASGTPVNFSLSGASAPLPPDFFGSTVTVDSGIVTNESDFIRATPARLLVWPGGGFGDRYDPMAGLMYGHLSLPGPAPSNETAFIALCREVGCHAIFQVPGEINSSTFAAEVVTYTEQTLGFHPDYWEIGNEPALWHHFGEPWESWNRTTVPAPTPQAYAEEVLAYGQAMRAVDPTIRIIGLPGVGLGGKTESAWLTAVASLDGSWISGLAIHTYPAGIGPRGATLPGFLATLNGANSLPSRIPVDRAAMNASCGRCSALPLFVTELGSAVLSGTYDPYVEGFPDAVFLGAEVVQALALNVTNVDTFAVRFTNPGSWENATSDVRPSYTLFSELLSRLHGTVRPLQPTGGVGGVYALEATQSGTSGATDLFVVNANSSTAIQIHPGSVPGFPPGPAETWAWNGSTSEPVANYWPTGLPAAWSVPPVGLLLIETHTAPSVPVTVTETGLATGERWYISLANEFETSGTPAVTFFLPAGVYPLVGSPTRTLPDGGREVVFVPPNVTVGSAPVGVTADYRIQYLLLVEATPSGAGVTLPESGWYNASAPVPIAAVARNGFAFAGWSHSGPSGYSGSLANTSVSLAGRTVEVANFTPAAAVPDPPPVGGTGDSPGPFAHGNLALPLAGALVFAAVVLNFHRRRARPPTAAAPGSPPNAESPPEPSRATDPPKPASVPVAGRLGVDDARRRAVLDRAHRLTAQIGRLPPHSPVEGVAVEGLRRSLALLRAAQVEQAEQILAQAERALDSGS